MVETPGPLTIVVPGTTKRVPAETFPFCEYIKDEMAARGWAGESLGRRLLMGPEDIRDLLNGRIEMSAELAHLLAGAFDTSSDFWINLDAANRSTDAPGTP